MKQSSVRGRSLRRYQVFAVLLGMVSMPLAAEAAGPAALSRNLDSGARYLSEGDNTLAPFAYVVFCMRNSAQCRDSAALATVPLDAQKSEELKAINVSVNKAIRPKADPAGQDVWSVDVASGDCEDYALTKRKRLMAAGWPSSALRIAVVRTAAGEGHAVLVVRTSDGDLVLDNRFGAVKRWNETGLTWLKVQSGAHPSQWLDLEKPAAAMAVSFKR